MVEAGDGPSAFATFEREAPALVVLDVNLPRLDGFEVCRRIRSHGSTPVLLLTVRNTEEDLVHGLDLGADDFLTKPFSPPTLLARLRALLRRAGVERPAPLLSGDFALDVEMQTARREIANEETRRVSAKTEAPDLTRLVPVARQVPPLQTTDILRSNPI